MMILCCLAGGPFFGGRLVFERVEAYENMVLCADVLEDFSKESWNLSPKKKLSLPDQHTKEEQEAEIKAKEEEEKRKKNPFSKVDVSYLDDAVFIGDSRTDTLRLYAGWDNTTYYVKTGTNIWAIMDDEVAKDPDTGDSISIDEALQKIKYNKVYIMLGVNELGTGTAETYYQQFKKVVERIKELQPDAIIFVQSIMHVADFADDDSTSVNNKAINERNSWLKKLADNEQVYFLDENEVLDDENGCLKAETTYDGVHLEANYIEPWKKFILKHGVVFKKQGEK